jgi:ribosome maturation factor RimP
MATADRVRDLVTPLLADRDLELYDLELTGGVLKVLVDREGGADLEAIAEATRAVSRALDDHDPIPGSYTLEVSTPGLERRLRTPEHFAGAIGESVAVKTVPGSEGERRVEGIVAAADDDGVTVRSDPDGQGPVDHHLHYDQIERARTTFAWGPPPKPKPDQKKRKRQP